MTELVVLTDRPSFLAEVRKAAPETDGVRIGSPDAGPRPSALDVCLSILEGRPNAILLIDAEVDPAAALLLVQEIFDRQGSVRVFLAGPPRDPDLILRSQRAGAAEFLPLPLERRTLLDAIQRLRRRLVPETAAVARKRGRVFPFLGTKGGCGTTTLSTNLAVTLAGRSRAVLLIDLHPWAGDISMLLNLKPAFGVADVALNVHRLDRELLGGMLVRHESGLHVLPASESPDKATLVQPSHVAQILNFARGLFDYVVVSTGEITDPLTLAAVNQGDLVHLVSCLDLLSLRRAQWVLRKMAQFGLSPDLLRLVINRYEKNPHISLEEAERILGLRVAWKVPAHPGTFQDALNEGVALVSRCRDDLSRCFEDYAGRLGAGETTRTTAPLRRKILGVFSSRGVKPAAEGGAPV